MPPGSMVATRFLALLLAALAAPSPAAARADAAFRVTDAERAWLAAHPRIRVAPAPNFPPMEYFDEEGVYRGLMADYAALLEERLGIEFEIVRCDDWQQVVAETQARRVDVWMEAQDTAERREFMRFTRPYVTLPAVIIVRRETTGDLDLADLAGMKVAVVEGYESSEYVRRRHPDLELVPVPSVEVGLARVSFGAADALVANIGTASHCIEQFGMTNLRVAGTSGFAWRLCLATRSDWPELHELLQRALDDIDPDERQRMYRRWIAMDQPSLLARRDFWVAIIVGLVVAGLVVTAILGWNRMLKRQVAARTEELRAELVRRRTVEEAVIGSTLELTGAAAQIAASARQQDGTLREFHESTSRAAVAVQEIAATSRNFARIIEEVSRVARRTAQNVGSGKEHLEGLDVIMGQMVEATAEVAANIERVRESSSRINQVTSTMTRVVDRTELLSVNSAIEAEKAGAHAGGFRVVAGEIRRLAGQSAAATLEIDSIVKGVHESVAQGVDQVRRFRDRMGESVAVAERISEELGEIITDVAGLSARFAEISSMMSAQTSGTDEVSASIERITGGARQISESSAEFAQVTEQLRSVAERLRGQVSSFAEPAGEPRADDDGATP